MARRGRLDRFVDPATRPDALGGRAVRFGDYTGAAAAANPFDDCLEVGPAGWDAATGTFDPQCRSNEYTTPYAGFVNHEADAGQLGARAARTPKVGPRDNRTPVGGGATIRRSSGLWAAPAGFGWFEHQKSDLGCLYMAYTPDPRYVRRPDRFPSESCPFGDVLDHQHRSSAVPSGYSGRAPGVRGGQGRGVASG